PSKARRRLRGATLSAHWSRALGLRCLPPRASVATEGSASMCGALRWLSWGSALSQVGSGGSRSSRCSYADGGSTQMPRHVPMSRPQGPSVWLGVSLYYARSSATAILCAALRRIRRWGQLLAERSDKVFSLGGGGRSWRSPMDSTGLMPTGAVVRALQ